ncbi:hypothetical protein ACHAWC_003943 [Mediolabrus comicus]
MSASVQPSDRVVAAGQNAAITALVCQRRWSILEHIMRRGGNDFFNNQVIGDGSDNGGQPSISDDLLIHFICRFQAPLHIVLLFAEAYPKSLKSVDALGRFPVHIACAWGLSPDTIQFLIESYPLAASIQDLSGKCPIHHLCISFMKHYADTPCQLVNASMMAIVKMLNVTAPKSFNLEDNDGMNALELAIETNVDIKIIKAMQRVCRDTWREMKKEKKDASHEELQTDLKRIQDGLRNHHISTTTSNSDDIIMKSGVVEAHLTPISGHLEVKVQVARMA